ncbi:MAG: DUF2341 domain-containing protein [Sphingomonas sp.]|uniref:DUF2341 domain-containing protein n=1 Tax=Sphingomonas sp. TaxID=28214 RepID=UPI0035682522
MKKKLLALAFLFLLGMPGMANAWWNKDWAERRKVTLDASVLRGVDGSTARVPVLIRLHSGVLDFSKVRKDGADLRFVAGDDKTPLAFHIERFDPAAELALVWVDVPQVAAGQRQEIWLYYGSANAKPVADPAASYDGEQSLVYHFSDGALPADSTANRNNATAFTGQPTVEGLIAGGARFAPASQLQVAPSQSLAIAANGRATASFWIKLANEAPAQDAAVYTKLGAGQSRLVVGLRAGVPYIRVVDAAGAVREASSTAPLAGGQWAHVAISAGQTLALYVDGTAVATLPGGLPELGGGEMIGANDQQAGFAGDVDEFGRANVDRSASAMAIAAQSQGRTATFAQVANEPEEAGSESTNYLGVLFRALTPDAWVVIGLLAVMLVLSWVVMISKGLTLSRIRKANTGFLAAYQKANDGRGAHDGLADTDVARWSGDSSLARLFSIGRREVNNRQAEQGTSRFALAPQSVAAIRSALDAGMAREGQLLHRRLVLLTIAISGGPFIGLLGTVLGVMITFAAVAAAGDVNINAIAPGIAAALLATVAGLAVAIPALFGYNYLLSQVDEVATDNLIFVDELEKRLAETYRPAPTLMAAE